MKFHQAGAEIFVPDGQASEAALRRTTVMAIAAHQDDLEILSYPGILQAFASETEHYTGVVVTNGSGSPRDGLYAKYSDEQMRDVRRREQKKAAVVGEYGATVFLDHPSGAVKSATDRQVVADIQALFAVARPGVVFTHNLADKHDTHVGVALKVIQALRELPAAARPRALYGGEVWRDLDWLADADKTVFDISAHENLASALVAVFDSQVAGGKRYDLATMGRRRAHATYYASHATDTAAALTFAMDLTPLLQEPELAPAALFKRYLAGFETEVMTRLQKLQSIAP